MDFNTFFYKRKRENKDKTQDEYYEETPIRFMEKEERHKRLLELHERKKLREIKSSDTTNKTQDEFYTKKPIRYLDKDARERRMQELHERRRQRELLKKEIELKEMEKLKREKRLSKERVERYERENKQREMERAKREERLKIEEAERVEREQERHIQTKKEWFWNWVLKESEENASLSAVIKKNQPFTYVGDIISFESQSNKSLESTLFLYGFYSICINNQTGNVFYHSILEQTYTFDCTIKSNSEEVISINDELMGTLYKIKFGFRTGSYRTDGNIPFTNEGKRVVQHLKIMNETVSKKREKLHLFLESRSKDFLGDKSVFRLIKNFIIKTDQKALLDMQFMREFERIIHNQYPIGSKTLNYSHTDIKNLLREPYATVINKNALIYMENSFLKLVSILRRRIDVSTLELVFLTWTLLRKVAVLHYHDLFVEEYGTYFTGTEMYGLEELLQVYVKADTLDPESIHMSHLFTYYLIKHGKFGKTENYNLCYLTLLPQLKEVLANKELDDFENQLLHLDNNSKLTMDDIDLMTGQEFELFVADLFKNMGYKVEVTKETGDQGIDVIAMKNGRKIGVQTKCYSSTVSNKAIQEVVAGLKYYSLDKGLVITNNYFTASAIELAESNNIILWNRNILKDKISTIGKLDQ